MSFSPAQCRAARGLLNWTQEDLSHAAGVSPKTVVDYEQENRDPFSKTVEALQDALESAGVEFTNGKRPGVRMRGKAT
jgi:transcriptional regulator with XRE-family HTH domain